MTLKDAAATHGSPFYDRPDVASFGQFAVRPSHQGCGIGSTLMRLVEQRARDKGAAALALDTAEHATHLIVMYEVKGYPVRRILPVAGHELPEHDSREMATVVTGWRRARWSQ